MISWWRYLNRSVEKPYYFQHYTGYVGGGGGNRTRVLLSFHLGIYKFSWNFSFSSNVLATNLLNLKHLLKSYCCYGGMQQPA